MAAGLTPSIIVLALGAGALGFPDALRLLLRDVAGRRSPVLDIAVCAVAMAALTAYALGAVLLVRFVRKAGPGAGAGGRAPPRRTDPFARLTLAVSLGAAAAAVLACLLLADAEPGAHGFALLCRRIVHDVAGESEPSHVVVSVLVAILLPCCITTRRLLLRGFRGDDVAHGAAPASTPTARLSVTITAQLAAAALLLLLLLVVVSAGLYARRGGSLVGVSAAVVGASMVVSRFTRNAADEGGRAALAPPGTTTRRFQAPSQLAVVVSFASLVLLLLVATAYAAATREREATGGAEY